MYINDLHTWIGLDKVSAFDDDNLLPGLRRNLCFFLSEVVPDPIPRSQILCTTTTNCHFIYSAHSRTCKMHEVFLKYLEIIPSIRWSCFIFHHSASFYRSFPPRVLKTERITHNRCISFCYFHFLCKTTLSQQLPFPCLDGFQFGSLSKDGLRHQVFLVRLRQLRAEVRLVEASLDVWELSFDGFCADLRMLYVLQQDGDDDFP